SKVYHNHIKPTQELIFSSYDIIKRFRTDIKGMEKYKSGAVSKIDGLESEAVSDVSKGTKAISKIAEVEDGINAVEKAGVEVGKISEYLYIKGDDLLRLNLNGEFKSL
nr:hypothetical protein [Lachnospiraceae bacterium]